MFNTAYRFLSIIYNTCKNFKHRQFATKLMFLKIVAGSFMAKRFVTGDITYIRKNCLRVLPVISKSHIIVVSALALVDALVYKESMILINHGGWKILKCINFSAILLM